MQSSATSVSLSRVKREEYELDFSSQKLGKNWAPGRASVESVGLSSVMSRVYATPPRWSYY